MVDTEGPGVQRDETGASGFRWILVHIPECLVLLRKEDRAQWVKSYSLSYSKNGYAYVPYRVGGRTKVSERIFKRMTSTIYSRLRFLVLLFYVSTALAQEPVVQGWC